MKIGKFEILPHNRGSRYVEVPSEIEGEALRNLEGFVTELASMRVRDLTRFFEVMHAFLSETNELPHDAWNTACYMHNVALYMLPGREAEEAQGFAEGYYVEGELYPDYDESGERLVSCRNCYKTVKESEAVEHGWRGCNQCRDTVNSV